MIRSKGSHFGCLGKMKVHSKALSYVLMQVDDNHKLIINLESCFKSVTVKAGQDVMAESVHIVRIK